MSVTDPIADFLTAIRNAVRAKKKYVEIPSSSMKVSIAEILKQNNYIRDFNVIEDDKQNIVRIHLKYINDVPSINGLKKISTPGLREYVNKDQIPRVLNGLGTAIISTSKGLLSDKQAKREEIGGEVVCYIW